MTDSTEEHGSCCAPTNSRESVGSFSRSEPSDTILPVYGLGARVEGSKRTADGVSRPTVEVSSRDTGHTGMKLLPGGTFRMGTDGTEGFPDDGEGPVREITLSPFYIDVHTVSNALFAEFIEATGYVTEAERFGWSFVFHGHVPKHLRKTGSVKRVPGLDWWLAVEGACWYRPEGRGSNVRKRQNFPAVHLSWNDASAYAAWSGKRLPTEAEWEYAARGGLDGKTFVWGDELRPNGKHMCNIWQGVFPEQDTGEDGYTGTCPVDAFQPNGFGLYNMAGNVWEWCSDWFSPTHHRECSDRDPVGPPEGSAKTMKGGSFLCHSSYCNRYRVAARTSNTPDSSTANMGFRCAVSA